MTEIEVWVCATPRSPHLAAALAALEAAGAEPRVVTATRGQGAAGARNEALARCTAPVLALVDDDVEVTAGWLDALRAVWTSPGAEELGCAAGPLSGAFTGTRPAWLGDALLPALGVDAGPPAGTRGDPLLPALGVGAGRLLAGARGGPLLPALGVDAGRLPADTRGDALLVAGRTFLAGNISFRADALRGVGGFWPARGAPGLRDRFSEEHRAQHELAAAGWRAAWVPGAAAVRRIDSTAVRPGDVLKLRAHTGSRAGALRVAGPGANAARGAAKAVAGATVATAQRDPAKAVARAARAVEYVGELSASVLPPRSLQPATRHTPFLQSVPAPARGPLASAGPWSYRAVRRMRGGTPVVLLYHRVATTGDDALGLQVSPRHFAEQLEVLCARRTPVALEEIVAGEAPRSAVAVTVDDGYVDSAEAILPALEAAGVPATVFVSTGHVRSRRAFWWDAVARLLRLAPDDAGPLRLAIGDDTRTWPARTAGERDFATLRLTSWLRAQPPELIDAALAAIGRWAGVDDPFAPDPDDRALTVDELRRLAASPLVTIGSHGVRHACLAALAPSERAAELERSRDDLRGWLGDVPAGFAYPYGVPGVDVDAATRRAASAAGYAYGVVNASGSLSRRTDPMGLPRAAAGDVGADAFDAWLRRSSGC